MAVRSVSEGKVGPIEWVNPPMAVGVEYRTTERFQGKPVYVKTINMGNLPGNSVKQVNFQNRNVVDKIVSVTGQCTSDSGVGISMPYHTVWTEFGNRNLYWCSNDRNSANRNIS